MSYSREEITAWITGRRSLLVEGIILSLEQSRFKSAHYVETPDCLRQRVNAPLRDQAILCMHVIEDMEMKEGVSETIRLIHQQWPNAIIVVIAAPRCVEHAEMASSGVSACLSTSFSSKELLFLLNLTIAAEENFFIYPFAKRRQHLINSTQAATLQEIESRNFVARVDPVTEGICFSPRECDIVAGLFRGDSNKTIARRLSISDATVKTHVRAVFRKLNAHNRTQAIRRVLAACPSGSSVDAWLRSPTNVAEHLHSIGSD